MHSAPAEEPSTSSELTVLRERVRYLERRVSDLDAQVALMTERLAAGGPAAPSAAAQRPPDPREMLARTGAEAGYASSPQVSSGRGGGPAASADWSSGQAVDLEKAPTVIEPRPALDSGEMRSVIDASEDETGAPPEDVAGAYAWAQARMKEGRYLEAIAAFEDILAQHREHDLADNALYWIAVCLHERGESRLAIERFQKLPMWFPNSPKLADSLYGLGLAHESLGEPVLAETMYAQLLQLYPRAERARDARRALRRLRPQP